MSQLTYRDGLIYPYEGTPTKLIDVTNAESVDALLTTEWFITVVDATANVTPVGVTLTAATATAAVTIDATASATPAGITLTAATATAGSSVSATATANNSNVNLVAATATAQVIIDATASATPIGVTLTAANGSASTSSSTTATANNASINLVAATATAQTTADAAPTVIPSGVTVTAATATATIVDTRVTQNLVFGSHVDTDASSYVLPLSTFVEGKLYVIFGTTSSASAPAPTITSISGSTASFTKVVAQTTVGNVRDSEAWIYKPSTTHTDTLTAQLSALSTSGDFTLIELTNAKSIVQSSGVNGAAALSGLVNLAAFSSAQNATLGYITHNAQQTTTPGAGFTGIDNGFHTNPPVSYVSLFNSSPDTSIDATWTTSSQWIALGLEVEQGVYVAPPTVQLVLGGVGKKTKKTETYKSKKERDLLVYNVVKSLFIEAEVVDISVKEVVAAITKTDAFNAKSSFSEAYLKEIARIQAQLIIDKLRSEDEADDEQALLLLL